MEATDVNQVVTVRALAIGFRLGAQSGDIEGVVDGFQLCRTQGEGFHQIVSHGVGNRHHVATLVNSLNFLLLHPAVKAGAVPEIGGREYAVQTEPDVTLAQRPAAENNPLFIYGNSGLGKTHLMYAIANVLRRTHPEFRIIYVKGEDFTNELITAIQKADVQSFRNKYRVVDLLLLDDVQFIAGKERTQEEFFHTFNALYEAKKQIVLTSDRPPKEINTLEERMKTRFEWGLLADIQPPDFETRIAIIRDKAVKMSIELPDEVSNYIAENIQSNIRQLEGAVKKIKAMHELMGERITVSLAENAIDALRTENPGLNPTPERIMEAVANYFYIPVEQMISKDRSKDVAYPRQMAMYMIRQELEYSFPDIAKIFKRDHTTVMHACNKIEEERKKSRQTEDVIKKLHNNIRGD